MALHDPKPLIKAFFLPQRKRTNYTHEMTQTAASTLFSLMSYPEAVSPWHRLKTSHCTSSAHCGLQPHLNTVQSPGAPGGQSTLCKHLQNHSQHLLENSDIHMPVMQTSLNLNISQNISELPSVLFPWDNPHLKRGETQKSVSCGWKKAQACLLVPSFPHLR